MLVPGPNNEYLVVLNHDDDGKENEESIEMDQLLVQASSYADGMTRRGRKKDYLLVPQDEHKSDEEGLRSESPVDVLEAAYEVLNLAPEERK